MPNCHFEDIQLAFFKIGVIILFIVSLFLKPVRNIINPYVNSFLVLATVVFFFIPEEARLRMIVPYINLFLSVIFFYIIVNYLKDRKIIYKAFSVVIVVNMIFVILQLLGLDPLCITTQGFQNKEPMGLFGFKMNLGAYSSFIMPITSPIILVLCLVLAIISKGWAMWVALTISGLVASYFMSKKVFKVLVYLLIPIALFTGFLFIKSPALQEKVDLRVRVHTPFLKVVCARPWTGYGMGSTSYVAKELDKKINIIGNIGKLEEVWDDYLDMIIQLGFGALAIMILMIRNVWKEFLRHFDREFLSLTISLFIIAIGMCFHSFMYYVNIGLPSLAIYALWNIKNREMA